MHLLAARSDHRDHLFPLSLGTDSSTAAAAGTRAPTGDDSAGLCHIMVRSIDALFRKMTNRNQTDTNEMATTETKYQTDFYYVGKYQY